MSTSLVLPPPAPSVGTALLPAVISDDPDERLVTDTLLDRVDLAADLEHWIDGLVELLEHATSPRTRRAYESDFAHFAGWSRDHGLPDLPAQPQTVALYITAQQETLRPASLLRRLSAIAVRHRSAGFDSPTGHELVRRAVAGLRRKHGARPAAKSAPGHRPARGHLRPTTRRDRTPLPHGRFAAGPAGAAASPRRRRSGPASPKGPSLAAGGLRRGATTQ